MNFISFSFFFFQKRKLTYKFSLNDFRVHGFDRLGATHDPVSRTGLPHKPTLHASNAAIGRSSSHRNRTSPAVIRRICHRPILGHRTHSSQTSLRSRQEMLCGSGARDDREKMFHKHQNKDVLCCARAIVTAKAKLDNDPRWNSIRQGQNIQKQLAEELHQLAGVQLRRCDLEDTKKFQSVLRDYQIHVVSKEAFNGIVFKGPEATKKICLYFHDDHFDVITTMAGFLGQGYYCNKGYNTKKKHACNEPCSYCRKCHDRLELTTSRMLNESATTRLSQPVCFSLSIMLFKHIHK